jgi:phosphatidate cytidylyltransferase
LIESARQRLFGIRHAFDSPVTVTLTVIAAALLVATPFVIYALKRAGKISPALEKDLRQRYLSWLVLAPLMIVPVLLGAFYTILAIGILSLLCYREFARATGLFREKLISLLVVVGIVLETFAAMDNWYELFVALWPLTVGSIAAAGILSDHPKGYIQRVALGVLAFMLFGSCFGHLSFFANDPNYRPILFWIVISVELNDVFAYITGKSFGRRKLAPNTSPNKTIGGALGALVLTTTLAAVVGHWVFHGTDIDRPVHLITLGLMISILGQLGDLLISSIKRDLDIKDMGQTFPGHGGLLDRFDSLILVAPAVFHYIGYFLGIGDPMEHRLFTGG